MKNRVLTSGLAILFVFILISSCDIINPSEPVPTTIHLNPFTFHILPGQGSAINKISEVWVYANGNNIGAFAPPVDIRYLEEGPTKFTFRPGIRNNGLANDAIVYPLFVGDSIDLVAAPGSEYEITPKTAYKTGTIFSLNSDFEIINDFTDDRDTITASHLVRSQVDVFEGNYSGQMTMSEQAYFIEVGHNVAMNNLPDDPGDNRPIYLELRYKNEVEFFIGILGIDLDGHEYSNFFYLVKPTEEWNMLYIELTDIIKSSGLPAYKILFSAAYPISATKSELNIFLDNIKVVHL